MPFDILQDGLVTLIAFGAAAVVVRRVFGFVRPAAKPACTNCASQKGACAPPVREERARPATHPVLFIRPSSR